MRFHWTLNTLSRDDFSFPPLELSDHGSFSRQSSVKVRNFSYQNFWFERFFALLVRTITRASDQESLHVKTFIGKLMRIEPRMIAKARAQSQFETLRLNFLSLWSLAPNSQSTKSAPAHAMRRVWFGERDYMINRSVNFMICINND